MSYHATGSILSAPFDLIKKIVGPDGPPDYRCSKDERALHPAACDILAAQWAKEEAAAGVKVTLDPSAISIFSPADQLRAAQIRAANEAKLKKGGSNQMLFWGAAAIGLGYLFLRKKK